MTDERTDEELLAAVRREPEAFGVFYRRHVPPCSATSCAARATPSWPPT